MEKEFISLLKTLYCKKIEHFNELGYKILLENEIYQEIDFEILFSHIEFLSKKLARIFQMQLPYLTLKSKQIHVKKFLQTGIVEEIWKPGSLDLFVECIMDRFLEATPWIPNHLRDKLAWNVSWQHWLYALFNATMKTSPPPKPFNKRILSCILELNNISVVEWNAAKIWQQSGIKVKSLNSSFEWEYYINKKSDVETYGWRIFEDPTDVETIISNCDMRHALEGEKRMLIDQWRTEEEKKRRKGNIGGSPTKQHGGFTREEVAKLYRNGEYTLEFGKKSSIRPFHELFYGDKLMDLKNSKLGFR